MRSASRSRRSTFAKAPSSNPGGRTVKYLLSWEPHAGGSPSDHEAAQKRMLQLFERWQVPPSMRILQFLKRVSDGGGYAVIECDDAAAIHGLTTAFAAVRYRVEPVLDLVDAAAAEAAALQWRDALG